MKKYRAKLISTQRKALLRIACTYRTASAEALLVITGVIPIDILAIERQQIHQTGGGHISENKTRAREEIIDVWQSRWQKNTGKAQWTKRLIPDLRPWIKCSFKGTDYGLTQFLTGHGSFESYTRRTTKSRDDLCVYCGECDTPEQTIFSDRWNPERQQLFLDVEQSLNTENIVDCMLENPGKYKRIWKFVSGTMIKKEKEER